MKINPDKIKKILCIKPRGIGDIILSTIVLDNLKNHFLNSSIDYLTEDFSKNALRYNPLINNVISMSRNDFPLKIAWRLRREKYDIIFDFWSNPRSAQITFLSGAKYRVGYSYRGRKYAYNIKGTSEKGDGHSAEHNLELLKPLGINIISKKIHYYVGSVEKMFADDFFKSNSLLDSLVIGVMPSGGWDSKRCDRQKWVEICLAAVREFNCKVLVLWGPGDEADAQFIQDNLDEYCVLAPKSPLEQLAALTANCSLVIANDSGPMHISAALGVPTLGIFGPTNPVSHRPFSTNSDYVIKDDLHCIICNKLICPFEHECMRDLDTSKVIFKVRTLLNEKA